MKKLMMLAAVVTLLGFTATTATAGEKYKETTITIAAQGTTGYAEFNLFDFANPWLSIDRVFAANTSGTGSGTVVWTLRDGDVALPAIWTSPGVGAGIISNGLPCKPGRT